MSSHKIVVLIVVVLVVASGWFVLFANTQPEEHVTPSASVDAQVEDDSALISVTNPIANERVANPILLSGTARGTWFFEAAAPVVVVDWDGRIIGESYIEAQGEWMTEEPVSFTGTISYELPADSYSASGTVIFRRANPSGLLEYDEAIEIPVTLR